MAESNYRFIPTYGTSDKIQSAVKDPGRFYVATDTGELYLDTSNNSRILIGGANSSIFMDMMSIL